MDDRSAYRTAELGMTTQEVITPDDVIVGAGHDGFAHGRYRARLLAPGLQYFDCDIRTFRDLATEGVFSAGICLTHAFSGRWDSRIGREHVALDDRVATLAYGAADDLPFEESQPGETAIRMGALVVSAGFLDRAAADEAMPASLMSLMRDGQLTRRALTGHGTIAGLFGHMYGCAQPGYLAGLRLGGLAHMAIAELGQASAVPAPSGRLQARRRELAHAVQGWICDHDGPIPPLAAIASHFGTSESNLRRAFHDTFDLPVASFIRNLLLDRARAQVCAGQGQIAEIAWAAGFSDPANFTTAYRRRFGHPPSRDRRIPD